MDYTYKIDSKADQVSIIGIEDWTDTAQLYSGFMRTIAIVDQSVAMYDEIHELFGEVITIQGGERCKTLEMAAQLWQMLSEVGADRQSVLVGIGGGTICDLVGFVASTYMRGIKCLLVPTTLLAQVDAAIGGKCGINFGGLKNMVGTFNLPGKVVCDPAWLATLPEREWRSGMAEVIKTAIIGDAQLFELLENNSLEEISTDYALCGEIIARSVAVKCAVVNNDFRESGARKVLNLGHTLGHAIEALTSDYSHGEAVAIGIAHAAQMAVERGLLSAEDCRRIVALLERYGLPTTTTLPAEELHEAMLHDKKNNRGQIGWVLPTGIGSLT
ncbi:MAG: 3-dehydroquinate synthase [Rikenellaceae bacterium]|nr:3-dehydroquinate synthase [Rikenellaceae bacterium]